jgi:hypothetical protein
MSDVFHVHDLFIEVDQVITLGVVAGFVGGSFIGHLTFQVANLDFGRGDGRRRKSTTVPTMLP